ncbi:MAG: hypothetical protein PVI30_25075 [Myxococcales bacterium]|jgi:hypothetical protein
MDTDDTHPSPNGMMAERSANTRLAKQLFFAAAFMSFLMSVYLFFSGDTDRGIFIGLWVPSILSAGNLLMTRCHDA